MSDPHDSRGAAAAADPADPFAGLAAQGYTHAAATCPLDLGGHSPLDAFQTFADQRDCYLLESLAGPDSREHFSFIGLPCAERVEIEEARARHLCSGELVSQSESIDPIAYLEEFFGRRKVATPPEMSRLDGGLVGYFAYDCIRYFEPRLAGCRHRLGDETFCPSIPDIIFLVSDEIIVYDHGSGDSALMVIVPLDGQGAWPKAQRRLAELGQRLERDLASAQPAPAAPPASALAWSSPATSMDISSHSRAIERIKRYIADGDVMQVVLSRSSSISCETEPLEIYRHMRAANPSPYMYYFNFGEFQLIGSSPETLVRTQGDVATLRPLAGTRKRGKDAAADEALAADLLSDAKERAEHLMLIDLGRNDLGRVCQIGSVVTTEKMKVEYYSHVMHIVSNVIGQLDSGHSPFRVLAAAFPAGTLSGAPKIRAMEIIEEIEPEPRGFYGGAVGYFAWNRTMNLAIAIRTAVIKDGRLYYRAGGGIVGDSVAEVEWQETVNKAQIILQAVAATAGQGASRATS